jgi:hypothetical protein
LKTNNKGKKEKIKDKDKATTVIKQHNILFLLPSFESLPMVGVLLLHYSSTY